MSQLQKNSNTFIQWHRDVEQKRKPNQKKSLATTKKQASKGTEGLSVSQFGLSEHERSVLRVFRRYLMTPGRMLCFSRPDIETFKVALARLTSDRFLLAEKFPGGFSLTEIGYAAMKDDA